LHGNGHRYLPASATMKSSWSRGSEWHRWDPHIHTPATALNNQFDDDWSGFFDAVEKATPVVEALGVTDYCTIAGYKEFCSRQIAGRAKNVKLVFPNVEFRLDVQTERKRGINLHLLFAPDDPNHVREIERVLSRLEFGYKERQYRCSPDDLIALGMATDASQTYSDGALRAGVAQFKLELKQLRRVFDEDHWIRRNCLVAVAASVEDGTSGLQKDSAFKAMREELESFAHVILSPGDSDRAFWLGKKSGCDRDYIEKHYRCLKPCLHGSDAHRLQDVLRPEKERFCWIRGELTFEGLRQTLLEPGARVHIGARPPVGPPAGDCISVLEIENAAWIEVPTMELNPGLVAIIGPKGSGKTALADFIAQAAGAPIHDGASFLLKAREHLEDSQAALTWRDGCRTDARRLDDRRPLQEPPRVRYLSQQFVDRLCSSDGVAGELLDEIEAVVFQAIPDEERLGAISFGELRDFKLGEVSDARVSLLARIQELTDRISVEDEKKSKLPALVTKQRDLVDRAGKSTKAMQGLIPKEKRKEGEELLRLQEVCTAKEKDLQRLRLRQTKLAHLEDAYTRLRADWHRESEALAEKYRDCGIRDEDWDLFRPLVSPGVGTVLGAAKTEVQRLIDAVTDGTTGTTRDDTLPTTWSLKDLRSRLTGLTVEIGVEKDRAKSHADLQKQLTALQQECERVSKEIEDVQLCDGRRRKAIDERRSAYAGIFDLFAQEEAVLEHLYAPLRERLEGEDGTRRLDFHVRRTVDLDAWVVRGEDLLDLRKAGPFQGRGRLEAVAAEKLVPAWRNGASAAVAAAMEAFLTEYMKGLTESRASHAGLQDVGRWLFSTEHVSLTYGIRYDGLEISTLSPGMRGIVLLMLYLAVDQWDMRPLVVDQPEENLDPQSVYDELVGYFRDAKRRRQIILVTHNPNLVVNADADQVIVAHAERAGSGLPKIRYSSGGLEDSRTRTDVCRILEGGARAFREREQRYAFPDDPRTGSP
jgi:ABC-type lipoprotein export system ATPase subunit